MNLHDIRAEYSKQQLKRSQCAEQPLTQFALWLEEAFAAQVNEPTAMNLATVGADGRPHARVVLLKEANDEGFVFFSNYAGSKGEDLAHNPFAALTFFWAELERQVRVTGRVERLPAAQSDAYFASRPYTSRIGAWASEQSRVIAGKSVLLARAAKFAAQYPADVPRPPHWGGYLLRPDMLEFWQGRPSRLHDRIRYRSDGTAWHKERLAP
ncbi:pyridoxamine 5'-phosphate oxidase [Conchiformibius kuhniae]|uniref:Pyridoxine/pyridoxamine 5'-phosphate oxidase n=1 Tax=Conchiformibius kuhniae TaxID=211502 RepID=A0ABD8B864_9NEIS|nr:pyridoxamine 5'-phosphate oxidase [Conchiformibius kuhniae]